MSLTKKVALTAATTLTAAGIALSSAGAAQAARYYSFDVGPYYAYTQAWTTAGEGSISQAWHGGCRADSGFARYHTAAYADCGFSYYYGGRVIWF